MLGAAHRITIRGKAVCGGKRYVCEELDEQSLDVSLDAVRDTATG